MTILFPDLSHYKTGIDVSKWPALITKATEATGFTDSTYASYKAAAVKLGIPFAGYHFLRKGSIDDQAKHAYSVIGSTPAMLDVETAGDGSYPSWSDVRQFITTYRGLGGVLHLAYIPKWFMQSRWGNPPLTWLTENSIALISSQYTTYSDSGPGWDPYGGVTPTIWQYTASYGTANIDMNAFKGTVDELRALFETGSIDMAMTASDAHTLLYTDDLVKPSADVIAASSNTTNTGWTVHGTLEWLVNHLFSQAAALADLQAKVAALPTTAAPAAPLSDADVARIAVAVLDEQHRRDAS